VSRPPAYARATTALWRRVGGEVLVTWPESTGVDRLSEPASAAWLLLERPRTVAELTGALADEFSVGSAEIEARVAELVGELEGRGWLVRMGRA
jgi:hypothetical protein